MSIFDTYRTEPELELEAGNLSVSIAKLGGGTVGHAYAGSWAVEISDAAGEILLSTDALETGTPKGHAQAAAIALEFLATENGGEDGWDGVMLDSLSVCDCCVSLIANGDESGCRDFYGHTHDTGSLPGAVVVCEDTDDETRWDRWECAACGQKMLPGATAHAVEVVA